MHPATFTSMRTGQSGPTMTPLRLVALHIMRSRAIRVDSTAEREYCSNREMRTAIKGNYHQV